MNNEPAIVLTNGWLNTAQAKTCYGLLRGTSRFKLLGVIDPKFPGRDAGEFVDGRPRGVPVYASIGDFMVRQTMRPRYCIVGVAFSGGQLPESFREEILQAMRHGLSVICGLHTYLSDDAEFREIAAENRVELIDIRKTRPVSELRFWSGEIYSVRTPRIAILGTDCAVGKRTTCQFLLEMCLSKGIRTEMIYTGQTGWLQGYRHGFIFDATINDFISGEIERVIVECDKESAPELMLIEGQSSMRNPSGPCGSEFIISGNVKGVVLQHVPGRGGFKGVKPPHDRIPSIDSEIELIRMLGAKTLAVTLSEESWSEETMKTYQEKLAGKLSIPVVRPLQEGVQRLFPVIKAFMAGNG